MKPLVTTTAASDVGQTSATLNGVVTPETVSPPDAGALCYFEYGTDTNYSMRTTGGGCGTGMGQVYDWETVTDLLPGTTYHYRLVASNRYGFGHDVAGHERRPAQRHVARRGEPTAGFATTYYFQYGKTAS